MSYLDLSYSPWHSLAAKRSEEDLPDSAMPVGRPQSTCPTVHLTLLEHLTWAVYDGVLTLGLVPHLESSESWGQIIKYLADKVFAMGCIPCCPTHMSAMFKEDREMEQPEGN